MAWTFSDYLIPYTTTTTHLSWCGSVLCYSSVRLKETHFWADPLAVKWSYDTCVMSVGTHSRKSRVQWIQAVTTALHLPPLTCSRDSKAFLITEIDYISSYMILEVSVCTWSVSAASISSWSHHSRPLWNVDTGNLAPTSLHTLI